jgi:excisionase family DNA binding protein
MEDDHGSLEALLSVPEAARLLGVAPVTLRRLVRADELPSVRVRDRVLVEPAAIRAYVKAHRQAAEPDGGP